MESGVQKERGEVVGVLSTEDLPRHLNPIVGRSLNDWRGRRFSQRDAESPTANHVPILNSCVSIDLDQLITGLLSQADGHTRWLHIAGSNQDLQRLSRASRRGRGGSCG